MAIPEEITSRRELNSAIAELDQRAKDGGLSRGERIGGYAQEVTALGSREMRARNDGLAFGAAKAIRGTARIIEDLALRLQG